MPPDRPLTKFALLRIGILKEIRTTFRERSQIAAVLIAVAMLVAVMVFRLLPAIRATQSAASGTRSATTRAAVVTTAPTTDPTSTTNPAPTTSASEPPSPRDDRPVHTGRPGDLHMSEDGIRWAAVGVASFIGFFFSVGYLFAAVLATFVGEKEGRTLEVLLACPMTDLSLYIVKGISVLIPSAILAGTFSALSILILAFAPETITQRIPSSVFWTTPILAVPLLVLVQAWFVGIGAAISARTETMKGAGQTLGVVLLLLCGCLYGIPAAVSQAGLGQGWVESTAADFFGRSFAEQYAMAVVIFACPAVVFLAIGRLCFRRDRMLT